MTVYFIIIKFIFQEFLVEQKLLSLLQPLEKNDQSMIKVDSIFKALGVETEDDVKLLAQYFVNHRQYLELIKRRSFIQLDPKVLQNIYRESGVGPGDDEASLEAGLDQMRITDGTSQGSSLPSNLLAALAKTIPSDKVELIHPNEVINALKTFVKLHHKSKQ